MNSSSVKPFHIIGIEVRTTNENDQATKDIPQLWNTFMSENVIARIPNKINNDIYCLYTNYESDFMKPYTTILGCKVDNLDSIPAGLTGKSVDEGKYATFKATGKLNEGIVFKEWQKIWNTELPRAYTTDFEIYGDKAKDADDAEIDIFVAIK